MAEFHKLFGYKKTANDTVACDVDDIVKLNYDFDNIPNIIVGETYNIHLILYYPAGDIFILKNNIHESVINLPAIQIENKHNVSKKYYILALFDILQQRGKMTIWDEHLVAYYAPTLLHHNTKDHYIILRAAPDVCFSQQLLISKLFIVDKSLGVRDNNYEYIALSRQEILNYKKCNNISILITIPIPEAEKLNNLKKYGLPIVDTRTYLFAPYGVIDSGDKRYYTHQTYDGHNNIEILRHLIEQI